LAKPKYCALAEGKGSTLFFVAYAYKKFTGSLTEDERLSQKKVFGRLSFFDLSDECVRLSALRIADKKESKLLS
jgi:hypothetical protein